MQSSKPRRSYCDFSVWPYDLEHCVTCCARLWDNFHQVWPSTTYSCLNYTFLMLIRYVTLWPWPLTRWPWKFVVHQTPRDRSLYEIWAKSSNPRLNYGQFCEFFCMLFHAVTLTFVLLTLAFYGTHLNSLHKLSEIDTCFDTVGWVIWPVKTRLRYNYNLFGETLNLALSIYLSISKSPSASPTNRLFSQPPTHYWCGQCSERRNWELGLSWLKQHLSDIFQPNLVVKCIFYCLTVVQYFILKSAHNDEISTKVTGR